MNKNSNLGISLFETMNGSPLDLGIDIAELTVDQFIENDLLKEIPFFSLFYKSIKTVQGIRDALFAMKVYKFIKEFEQIRQIDKEEFFEKINSDRKEKIRIGQTLIMILDKIDELDKIHLIANIFAAYLKAEISKSELTQFCSIVEKAFIDDLLLFSKMIKHNDLSNEIQANMSSLGLMTPIIMDIKSMYGNSVIIKDENNRNMIVYVVSTMGSKMRKHILK